MSDTSTETIIDHAALIDRRAARALDASAWVALHVPRFNCAAPLFAHYKDYLHEVLEQACERLAANGHVESRTKELASYARKILKKRDQYLADQNDLPVDPLLRVTDLCGARVVVQTQAEVKAICRFIEAAFAIDRTNSGDISMRLKPTEFGYRSVHYIVHIDPSRMRAAGVRIDPPAMLLGGLDSATLGAHVDQKPLRAEIQIRTYLEHAAASMGHDTIYKSELRVPDRIRRLHSTLSAVLEDVDRGFAQMLAELEELQSNVGNTANRAAAEGELKHLQIVLKHDPANIDLTLKTARQAIALGEYDTAEKVLRGRAENAAVNRLLGEVLIEIHQETPEGPGFAEGIELLEIACAQPPKDAETLHLLADAVSARSPNRARNLFTEAIEINPANPVVLARYLEFEIAHLDNGTAISLCAPMILTAMALCRKKIEAEVDQAAAWASLAWFHLLRKQPYEALNALAQCAILCQPHPSATSGIPVRPAVCAAGRALRRLYQSVERINGQSTNLPGYNWFKQALLLMLAVRLNDSNAMAELRKQKPGTAVAGDFLTPHHVVIMAGSCAPEFEPAIERLRPYLLRACQNLEFALIAGGTTVGINALAGDVAMLSQGKIRAIGYLPGSLPHDIHVEGDTQRFNKIKTSDGQGFTPLDPLLAWRDLVLTRVPSIRIKVLAYAPGKIAQAEIKIALAFGVRVGVINDEGLPEERQFLDPDWTNHPNLLRLPMDAMTLRAFLEIDELPSDPQTLQRFEKAAELAHQEYVQSTIPKDPSLQKWADLPADLKLSNYHQIAFWEQMLRQRGIGIREWTNPNNLPKMTDLFAPEVIREFAEMEHGRWNVERLVRGWKHAQSKDVANKLNPCLVAWTTLKNVNGQDYQSYDVEAIANMPKKLKEAGLELYRIPTESTPGTTANPLVL